MAFVPGYGYRVGDENAPYFITMTVVAWVDVFTRKRYRDIIIDSLKYAQENKGLELYAYVIMSNHIHLMARTTEPHSISDFIRDFKKFTNREIIKAIEDGLDVESRRNWLLNMFGFVGKNNSNNENYQFWQNDNHPLVLFKPEFIKQKFDYIHQNPVKAGIVDYPEEYIYSSARNYAERESIIDVIKLPIFSL